MLSPILLDTALKVPARAIKEKKKDMHIDKEEVKLSLFADLLSRKLLSYK